MQRDASEEDSTYSENRSLLNIQYYTVDNMIEKTGGFGKIQIAILICMLIASIPTSFYVHSLTVLEQFPEYLWKNEEGHDYRCTERDICRRGVPRADLEWRVNWESRKSIKSWVHEMDLIWYPKYKIGLFGSIYFLGFAFSGLFLKFSDHFGRRRVIQAGWLLSCFVVTYLYAFSNVYMRYSMLFLLGVISFRLVALYILIMELSPRDHQLYVSAGYAVIDHYIGVIIPTLYFKFIGKDYKVVFIIAVFAAPISFILSMLLPESPRYYYEKRKMDELKDEFKRIADINQTRVPERYEFIKENGEVADNDNKDHRYVWNMLKDFQIVMNLIVVILTFSAVSFNTNLVSFHSKYFNANGYDTNICISHANILGVAVALIMRKLLSTKVLITFAFCLTAVWTVPLITVPQVDIATILWVVGWQTGISMCFYLSMLSISELFPPLFVAFVFFCWNLGASAANCLTPLLAEARHPIPMKLMFFISLGLWLLNFTTILESSLQDKWKETK